MEEEITLEELVHIVNESTGEFVIHVKPGKESDADGTEKPVPV